ncbi:MAG: DNA replication/repair protein RecF [Magnetococcales bacterium]|nr:DNA replication/repair protein RecF [Magnetococcales bacterium]NGZ28320.1 DNA replication/repair protein RecF [Magnetococcales bacterium]
MSFLETIQLHDFRNIAEASLALDSGFNLIVGDNGQGKSNLLEAVGILATGRSFRQAAPSLLRRNGCKFFRLEGLVRHRGDGHRLAFVGQVEGQRAWCNGKPLAAASLLGETMAVVVVAPETLRLVRGSPGERRAFLDWLIFGRRRQHVAMMRDYQKAVLSRNALLRRGDATPELDAWEDRMAVLGAAIALIRRQTVGELLAPLQEMLVKMGLPGERFRINYGAQLPKTEDDLTPQEVADHYRRLLVEAREGDRRQGQSSVGPHRDDLRLLMDGHPLARYASQGQQRRFVLAIKLAEAALLQHHRGFKPLLLLDDPMAELDAAGISLLWEILAADDGQILAVSCRPEEMAWTGQPAKRFRVCNGVFQQEG